MATIINNPAAGTNAGTTESSSVGTLVAVIVALLAIGALLFFGIPYLRGQSGSTNGTNSASVNVPSQVDVTVPDKLNVDVNRQ